MNIIENIDAEIAKLQAARALLLNQGHAPAPQVAKPLIKQGRVKRFVSAETKAKMKASQQARHARKALAMPPAEPVAASVTESAPTEPKIKAKPSKAAFNPSATSAMQSILPAQTN